MSKLWFTSMYQQTGYGRSHEQDARQSLPDCIDDLITCRYRRVFYELG